MADRYYIPGSWYVTCDISGLKTRVGETRKEWNGLLVRGRFYEERQPQDLVTGVRDDQTVPDARPQPAPIYALVATYVTGAVPIGVGNEMFDSGGNAMFDSGGNLMFDSSTGSSSVLPVASSAGFYVGAEVSIMLDVGVPFITTITAMTLTSITVTPGLPAAISGAFDNQVLLGSPTRGSAWTSDFSVSFV